MRFFCKEMSEYYGSESETSYIFFQHPLPEFYGGDWVSEGFVVTLAVPSWWKSHLCEHHVNIFTAFFPCEVKQQNMVCSTASVLPINFL